MQATFRSLGLYGTLTLALALTQPVLAGSIVGSRHDLSSGSSPEVCIWCHTPHIANEAAEGPLWNRSISAATFTLYSSASMDTTPGQPGGVSLMCLGCHDGVLGPDQTGSGQDNKHALFNYHGSPDTTSYPNCERCHSDLYSGKERTLVLGTDLSDDHPIGMTYPTAGQDPKFNAPPNPSEGWGAGSVRLVQGRVECVSCHDVHNPDIQPFLVQANTGSSLCMVCHNM